MVLSVQGSVPSDLTPEECQELENIRRRKQELLADIQRLKDEIAEVTNEIENLGSTEERKNMQRNKQVAMGRKKFNMDPKKGIQFLIENDLLKNTCEDIAQFLYKGEGLNKTAIGDYLGERDEFNIQVLHAFVELHEFTDLNLVQALRQFLWSFRLPGEAQKIDRMMEAFAQRYCQCNPGVFQSTDTCYVLSFAIIMLNTSLHNPNVKDKPTAERFIAMNRGINDGGDLPEELLQNLYESIKNEPFKIPEDDGNDLTHTFFNPDREGWLLKLVTAASCQSRPWEQVASCPRLRAYPLHATDQSLPHPVQHSHSRIQLHMQAACMASPLHRPPAPWLLWLLLSAALGNFVRVKGGGNGCCRTGVWWDLSLGLSLGSGLCPLSQGVFQPYCHLLVWERDLTLLHALTRAEPSCGAQQGPSAPSSGWGITGRAQTCPSCPKQAQGVEGPHAGQNPL
ncbi:cytohesin-1 isoform X2 [Melopsittacus undulatus]|uniref:cytohesin-1 isoform X2 n=1 Tax=Melopsittacus undulatus TaxID=13146 RepID=UPI00146EE3F7|nr:cytohesin-1 isoform X2 [Melopsittacus undulatus]